jgi:hypothetical protein
VDKSRPLADADHTSELKEAASSVGALGVANTSQLFEEPCGGKFIDF